MIPNPQFLNLEDGSSWRNKLLDFYIFVGGVFSVQVRYWICPITEIHHSIPFVVEMVFVAIPESISGVKASLGWNIGPLIEAKMPLSYQVSSVAWRENKGTIIWQKQGNGNSAGYDDQRPLSGKTRRDGRGKPFKGKGHFYLTSVVPSVATRLLSMEAHGAPSNPPATVSAPLYGYSKLHGSEESRSRRWSHWRSNRGSLAQKAAH